MSNKKADIVEVLRELISINSITLERGGKEDAEHEIGRHLANCLKQMGCNVRLQRVRGNVDNVIGIFEVDKSRPFRISE